MKSQMKTIVISSLKGSFVIAAALLLAGCLSGGRTQTKIPFAEIKSGTQAENRILVVVLPGRGDDVANLQKSGITEAIQTSMPEADVALTGVSLGYYMEGRMPQRLHEEIILPAHARGYKEIWLVGASMGGMGVLLYERQYPGEVSGMVLLAPYLGGNKVLSQIKQAGGLENWEAGPVPDAIDGNNFDRELWRYLKTWQSTNESRADAAWLAYGNDDRLRMAMPPLQKMLEPDHVFIREGGHAWAVWVPAAKEIFADIEKERQTHAAK